MRPRFTMEITSSGDVPFVTKSVPLSRYAPLAANAALRMDVSGAFVMGLVGCGGTDSSDKSAESKENNNSEAFVTDSAEITVDDVRNHAETPASDFEYIDNGDSVFIKAYNGSDPIVVIPEQIDGKDVISIINGPFSNDSLKYVDLGYNLKEFDDVYFSDTLEVIHLPAGVENLDKVVFFGEDTLTIVGKAGSFAETFAKEEGIKFEAE